MQNAPAADRNKAPILDVLCKNLSQEFSGKVLEVASGTGQHVTHFAQTFTKATFQPSDFEESHLQSIAAYVAEYKLTNVLVPICVDITTPVSSWPGQQSPGSYDIIYNSNMVHISPWQTAIGLFSAAGILLKPDGLLITYGPYAVNGVLEPDSNVRFNQSLKKSDPTWGIRDTKELSEQAAKNGIKLVNKVDMPANNKVLIWQKTTGDT